VKATLNPDAALALSKLEGFLLIMQGPNALARKFVQDRSKAKNSCCNQCPSEEETKMNAVF